MQNGSGFPTCGSRRERPEAIWFEISDRAFKSRRTLKAGFHLPEIFASRS
jgi:rRNA maturation protein Nop10